MKIVGHSGSVTRAFSRIVKDTAIEGRYSQEFFIETQKAKDGSWVEWEKTFSTQKIDSTGFLGLIAFMNRTRDTFPNNTGAFLYFFLGKNQKYYPFPKPLGIPGFIYSVWYGVEIIGTSWTGKIEFQKIKFRMYTIETTLVSVFLDKLNLIGSRETLPILLDRMGDDITDVVENEYTLPNSFKLFQNYPNPFNPETKIRFELSSTKFVRLQVFDALGREIAVLVNEEKFPGSYEVKFNASHLSSGIYYYVLRAGSFTESKKMTLIK